MEATPRLEFGLLGPLEAFVGGERVPLGGTRARQRAALAFLLVHAGESVSTDQLIDALWGECPPATARTALHGHVAALRRLLEPRRDRRADGEILVSQAGGYLLRIESEALDSHRFEALLARGRDLLDDGRSGAAARLLRDALALWRGPALGDLAYEPWAHREAERLEELRRVCLEERIEADLASGRHVELVGELEALIGDQPLRERPRGQLMRALYRQGRQAEALECFQRTRALLDGELGIEPTAELKELQRRILNQDPALAGDQVSLQATLGLPTPTTAFLGRERERAQLRALLSRDDVRLLTLTGPGGTGKTRLALEAARAAAPAYRDGVCWVALQAVREAELLLPAIASALKVEGELAGPLAELELLLILDNFEQLQEGAAALAPLLTTAPRLTLLVTSRERLHLYGEHEYRVPTLDPTEAVELFAARAAAVQGQLDSNGFVEAICERLDHLPLAIELAAAHTRSISPELIHSRLEQRLPLLTGGPIDMPRRHQTLHAAIEWSHELLTESERVLFRRLSVFSGGCPVLATEHVCGGDLETLLALADKSLIRSRGERVWMLETIREYAAERLAESADAAATCEAHARWCLGAVQDALASEEALERAWLEHNNARAAVRWARASGEAVLELELAIQAGRILSVRGSLNEAHELLASALRNASEAPIHLRAQALHEAAGIALKQGDSSAVETLSEAALELARTTEDTEAVVRALAKLSTVALDNDDLERASRYAQEALSAARRASDDRSTLHALNALGLVELAREHYGVAREAFEQALEVIARQSQAPRRETVATLQYNVALAALLGGDFDDAEQIFGAALQLYRDQAHLEGIAYCLAAQAALRVRTGELAEGAVLLASAERLLDEVGAALEPVERELADRTRAAFKSRLEAGELTQLRAEGHARAETELARLRAE